MTIKEARRVGARGIEIVVRGENVEPIDAVLAEVLLGVVAENGKNRTLSRLQRS